jgi:hypothetical protein
LNFAIWRFGKFGDLVIWEYRGSEDRQITQSPNHQLAKLPATLDHPGDFPLERQLAETEAAQVELPHVRPRAPAQTAPVAVTDAVLVRPGFFRDLCSCRHSEFSIPNS